MKTDKKAITGSDLINVLDAADATTLAGLDEQIAGLTKQLATLEAVRRLVDVRVNGKPERKKQEPRKPKPEGAYTPAATDKRMNIAKLLLREGPLTKEVICNRLNLPAQGFASTLDHPWFELTMRGVALTDSGKRAAA